VKRTGAGAQDVAFIGYRVTCDATFAVRVRCASANGWRCAYAATSERYQRVCIASGSAPRGRQAAERQRQRLGSAETGWRRRTYRGTFSPAGGYRRRQAATGRRYPAYIAFLLLLLPMIVANAIGSPGAAAHVFICLLCSVCWRSVMAWLFAGGDIFPPAVAMRRNFSSGAAIRRDSIAIVVSMLW